jgi:hypothetical protein
MTQTAAAHITTFRNVERTGEPSIVVIDHEHGAERLAEIPLHMGDVNDAVAVLAENGWRVTGEASMQAPGYWILDVEPA